MADPTSPLDLPLRTNRLLVAQRGRGLLCQADATTLKYGVFHSVVDFQAAINRFIKEHNLDPRPFIWKADPNQIIAAVRRGHQTLRSLP